MLSRVAIIIAVVAFSGGCAAMKTGSEWKVVGKGAFPLASIPETGLLGGDPIKDGPKKGGRMPRVRRGQWRKLSPEEAAAYLAFKTTTNHAALDSEEDSV